MNINIQASRLRSQVASTDPSKRNEPYRLDQTALDLGSRISVLDTSDGLGWANLNVSVVSSRPYDDVIVHQGVSDLWINMTLDPMELTVAEGRQEQRLVMPVDRISIIAPGMSLGSRRANEGRGLHAFVKRQILAEVAGEVFDCDLNSIEIVSAFAFEDPKMTLLLHSLKEALFEPAAHARLKVEYLSRALAVDALRKNSVSGLKTRVADTGVPLTRNQHRLVTDYIREHLSSEIRLNDLAALAGASRTNFLRRFKASTGRTPHRYLIETRLRRACELLGQTNLPMNEIAVVCGFADQAHFSATFRRVIGTTPSQYRGQIR